ncbi:hypothetical protein D9619_005064 [Psilocybe cf. subviscida]|uniref:Uncharacterized protein n=1 Tax=Psilocybe cf. subviscida TaxID=2480587 RepID=A0A8H5BPD5_9AGAR|nr:hypothetical protein D9619_005064 [Psilocybe cf. subviscida]
MSLTTAKQPPSSPRSTSIHPLNRSVVSPNTHQHPPRPAVVGDPPSLSDLHARMPEDKQMTSQPRGYLQTGTLILKRKVGLHSIPAPRRSPLIGPRGGTPLAPGACWAQLSERLCASIDYLVVLLVSTRPRWSSLEPPIQFIFFFYFPPRFKSSASPLPRRPTTCRISLPAGRQQATSKR